MNPRLKKWLIRGFAVGVGLFLVTYGLRDFWFRQLRIYILGLEEVRAEEYGYRLPEVDEIEVMALAAGWPTAPNGSDQVAGYPVTGRTVLRAEDAGNVAGLWRSIRRGREFSAMCHEPVYALRFRQHGTLLFETTICWHCHNYTIPFGILGRSEYGFDSQSEKAQALLAFLQSRVPLPVKPHA